MSSRIKHSDWFCDTCRFKVFGSKSECSKCHARRPSGSSGPRAERSSGGRRGDWDCPKCKVTIYASKSECRKCHSKKPGSVAASTNEEPAEPDWSCSQCQKVVFGWRSSCPGCRTPKSGKNAAASQTDGRENEEPAAPDRDFDDWNCTNCGDQVFGSKLACRCGHRRPGCDEVLIDGDWECTLCHELNFRVRNTCRRCDAPHRAPRRRHEANGDDNTNASTAKTSDAEEGEPASLCVVCLDGAPSVVLTSCGHMCMCTSCSSIITKCPMCRADFSSEQVLKVFVS
jgi:Zinc finger, C3HC4 type (RING finger)/Zn-finger in Ran binding protein and others